MIVEYHKFPKIDTSWTLFLDRDGVINSFRHIEKIDSIEKFEWLPGSLEALSSLSVYFQKNIIVTNQQLIGRGIIKSMDVEKIHFYIQDKVKEYGGKIDAIYYCPYPSEYKSNCRKPKIGMALKAKLNFPDINFNKSIVLGDTSIDMEFGKNIGAYTILVQDVLSEIVPINTDMQVSSLFEFYQYLIAIQRE